MTARDMINVAGVSVEFPTAGGERLRAVEDVSFSLREGEILGIIGESGSGKSTLGRVVAMLAEPSAGSLAIEGEAVALGNRRAVRGKRSTIQMIFQDPSAALNPRKSIGWSVGEPLGLAGWKRADRNARVSELLEQVGLGPEFAERYPHQLSGGQKQRVNIARALGLKPRLMVCDEVVSALDVSIQAEILNLFMRIRDDLGIAFMFITHDLSVVSHISDRVAVMYLGKFMELGPADLVHDDPLHPYTMALLSSEPKPLAHTGGKLTRILLEGEIPNPINPPSGCRFRTRCPMAQPICAEQEPVWREAVPGRWVRCHFAEAVEQLP